MRTHVARACLLSLLLTATCLAFKAPALEGAAFSRRLSRLAANVAVFGGTGKTGSECVYQTIKSGSKPFVLARDFSKLKVPMGSGGSLGGTSFYDSKIKV
jgi:hypothetical protein